ncbi:MAG TPA: endopeptidase La [Aggregatilineaceae bacterium]|jgi:ATP-dependent Lon protease|nr:endopeptidase La [Anaerolineae bacterium]HMM27471.1 endopeptidase La [Aggregatilineaceae bacterium]
MAKRKQKPEETPPSGTLSPEEESATTQTVNTEVSNDNEVTLDVHQEDTNSAAEAAQQSGDRPDNTEIALDRPRELPLLPLRGLVVYPLTTIPLTVGQPRSIRLVDEVVAGDRVIALVASRDPELETPGPEDVYEYGTLAQIHRLFRAPDGTIRLLVQGVARIRVEEWTRTEPYLVARVAAAPETVEESIEVEALMRNVVEQFGRMADLVPSIPSELINAAINVEDPLQLVYALATYIRISIEDQQNLLEIDSVLEKLRVLMGILNKELEVLELGHKIQSEAQSEMEKMQREYFLREQLKAIQRELGEGDEQTVEIEEFRQKIEQSNMPEEAGREARRELDRLARLPTAAAEYGVIRTYLDWMVSLPWDERTDDNLDIAHARAVLDEDHYGLEDVKERILEYLAVRKLRQERAGEIEERRPTGALVRREREGAILCFVGPPGVGKTSLGASIARAMGRKFTRLSLGGIRDEAEIRGFRRTYIGAMPGRIIQTLRRVESRNPVLMLDEVDKIGRDFRGDPASALLEVLDPEQNHEFRDHYLDVPFDLSEVMFITTANTLETVPGPLLDRMEVIALSGYTEYEKLQIAQQYLVPRQIRENGLRPEELSFSDDALLKIIRDYTREAGVRGLEREIGRVARKIVTRIAEGTLEHKRVEADDIIELLDYPRFGYRTEIEERVDTPGVAVGLAVTAVGGDVLFVEAAQMPGKGNFQYTGQLGQVMQESARAAYSYVRAKAQDLNVEADFFDTRDIHLHVPAGAVPKDGPSAGVTMATALASLITQRPVRGGVAMTGEITLRGQVLPVGGIKDKVLAAHRAGLTTVILPRRNEHDLDDVPQDVRDQMTFRLVDSVTDVLDAALVEAGEAEREPALAAEQAK